MVTLLPIEIEGHTVMGVEVKLPKTTLLAVYTSRGYIMCGAGNMVYFYGISQVVGKCDNPLWDKALEDFFIS